MKTIAAVMKIASTIFAGAAVVIYSASVIALPILLSLSCIKYLLS